MSQPKDDLFHVEQKPGRLSEEQREFLHGQDGLWADYSTDVPLEPPRINGSQVPGMSDAAMEFYRKRIAAKWGIKAPDVPRGTVEPQ